MSFLIACAHLKVIVQLDARRYISLLPSVGKKVVILHSPCSAEIGNLLI